MSDPITTAEQMREAAARLCEKHGMAIPYGGTKPTHGQYTMVEAEDFGSHTGQGYAAAIRAIPIASPADDEAMVERVARAICEDERGVDANWDDYATKARAALRAMGGRDE